MAAVLPFPAAVTAYLFDRTGTVTAALFDVAKSQSYGLNPGVVEDEASIVKSDDEVYAPACGADP